VTEGESHGNAPGKTDPHFCGDQNISLVKIFKSNLMPVNVHLLGYASTFSRPNSSLVLISSLKMAIKAEIMKVNISQVILF
jgi:hypothetical protein